MLPPSELWRTRLALSSNQDIISFCSNDYLGLAKHPDIILACQKATEIFGVGSGSSQYISGYREVHQQLEQDFSDFLNRDSALLFPTGYMANIGVLSSLGTKNTVILQDKFNHASLIDAGKLSDATVKRYSHNNIDHLELLLRKYPNQKKYVVTESIFSMRGDEGKINEIQTLAEQYNATLIIDDSDGLGWLGEHGAGIVEHLQLNQDQAPLIISSLGKIFGCAGGIVIGRHQEIEIMQQTARTAIYTTALPPSIAAAAGESLKLIQQAQPLRIKLKNLIQYFKNTAAKLGLSLLPSDCPIQILPIGSATATMNVYHNLLSQGLMVAAIRPPTAPHNQSCLRINLSSSHNESQIDYLLEKIAHHLPSNTDYNISNVCP